MANHGDWVPIKARGALGAFKRVCRVGRITVGWPENTAKFVHTYEIEVDSCITGGDLSRVKASEDLGKRCAGNALQTCAVPVVICVTLRAK